MIDHTATRQYRVTIGFRVNRRIDWQDDPEELRRHLDRVVEYLATCGRVAAVEVKADLGVARLDLELIVDAADRVTAEAEARTAAAAAIRESGAHHVGLLPPADERILRPKLNAWAGLRTPSWHQRRIDLTDL